MIIKLSITVFISVKEYHDVILVLPLRDSYTSLISHHPVARGHATRTRAEKPLFRQPVDSFFQIFIGNIILS
jgi:hypothetical protein